MNPERIKAGKAVVQVRRRRRHARDGIRMQAHHQTLPAVFPTGVVAEHGQKQVADMKDKGEREKKEMQVLNIKLANVLEKIRVVDAENKHLKGRLEIKVDFRCDEMKKLYEDQLDDLKARQVENDKKLSEIQSKNETLEELVEDLSEQQFKNSISIKFDWFGRKKLSRCIWTSCKSLTIFPHNEFCSRMAQYQENMVDGAGSGEPKVHLVSLCSGVKRRWSHLAETFENPSSFVTMLSALSIEMRTLSAF
uniref:Uncharacterized protein n=1 Tax=Octopus bimaculoides TaxID=37653 RepID=A0A0L8GZD8_OCTBM